MQNGQVSRIHSVLFSLQRSERPRLKCLVALVFGLLLLPALGQGLGNVGAAPKGALSAPRPVAAPGGPTLGVIGGLAGTTQFTQLEAPFWSAELERLSGGKYSASVVAFDRAGVPDAEMLRLMQLGVVPFGTVLMGSLSGQFPQYTAPDLAGLNLNIEDLRTSVKAFRPYLENALREEQGIELLALYIYPAQMVFCAQPFQHLEDIKGRRVRVSSAAQADFVSALGGMAVHTAFTQIMSRFEAGSIDCAITGTLSGSTLGLARMTTHLYQLPINWGVAIFGANRAAWEALPADLRALLRTELPRLEARIWNESERDTAKGLACLAGQAPCGDGKRAQMQLVAATPADRKAAQGVFANSVLPRWLQRCGPQCAGIWRRTIGSARDIGVSRP